MNVRGAGVVGIAVVVVLMLGGCAVLADGSRPPFQTERVRVSTIVEGIKESLPEEMIISVENDEGVTSCGGGDLIAGGGDGSQVSAYRRIVVAPEFDAMRWMDALADEYDRKTGWKVDREGENTTFPGSRRDDFWAPAGNSIGISLNPGKLTAIGFNARKDAVGEPVQLIAIDASAECADKPANWDGFGDFLTETPLPTPLPSLPEE